ITKLGVGEALVSTLEAKGVPSVVQRTLVRPPASRLGPISDAERKKIMLSSPVAGQYDETVDRESAYEVLQKRAEKAALEESEAARREQEESEREDAMRKRDAEERTAGTSWRIPGFGDDEEESRRRTSTKSRTTRSRTSSRQGVAEAAMKSVVRSVGSSLGRALVRGILGSLRR
ncbi:MAG: DUF853 family protein, partial [Notoacmeibacter sp.]|nr:DUF853 family protein [Notoacmeibacter sp.]